MTTAEASGGAAEQTATQGRPSSAGTTFPR